MTTSQQRTIVGVTPPGAPMPAVGDAMRGIGSCYPPDSLTMQNAPDGGLWFIYDPTTATAVAAQQDRDSGNTGDASFSVGTANNDDYTVSDADLVTFAVSATEEDAAAGVQAMAEWVKNQLDAQGAANYLAYSLNHPDGNRYAFTLQRVGGVTPAEKIADQATEIEDLKSEIVTWRAKTTAARTAARTTVEAGQVAIDERNAEIARLHTTLAAITAERDDLRWRMDGLEK